MVKLEGEHNSKRDISWIRKGVLFTLRIFKIEVKDLKISDCRKLQENVFHFSSFSAMVDQAGNTQLIDSEFEDDYMNDFQEVHRFLDNCFSLHNQWLFYKSFIFKII